LATGGAFGAKHRSPVADDAERLAAQLHQPVRVLWSREEVVGRGPKRPPVAMALRADGRGVIRLGRTAGSPELSPLFDQVAWAAPLLAVEEVSILGPRVSPELRGSGWVEASVFAAGWRARVAGTVGPDAPVELRAPGGGRARVVVRSDGTVGVDVWAGEVLDEVVLRSYCVGAVHQALGWVWSEGVAVAPDGAVLDLTIRSFGILNALEMPQVDVTVHRGDHWPCNGSDAVFAATAAAAWVAEGLPETWPTRR
jgi:CO/xanthine dehydrogenase Mo-binding subunit